MNGHLTDQPLVELIREISFQRLGGTLRLSQKSAKTVIYLNQGQISYAASNLRELRLAEYLKKQSLVSEEQLQSLGGNKSDLAIASALSKRGLVDKQTVANLITRQVTDVLRVTLLITEGDWGFDRHIHLSEPVQVRLDISDLLLQAARKLPPQFVAARLTNPFEIISPASGVPDSAGLLPAEGFMLSRVEAPTELKQLVSLSGLPELEALKTIYGLALGGFIEREHWPSALKKDVVRTAPAEVPQPAEPSVAEVSVHTLAAQLQELLDRLKAATSHYEVLDVHSTAGSDEIKSSYYALARRYHPDRFHMQAGTPLHASIESAFARIAQAYVTLADPTQRSVYDGKLASRDRARQQETASPASTKRRRVVETRSTTDAESSADNDWNRAESSFQEGFLALQQGQTQAAITNLAAAARIAPTEARFRAYYGRALASLPDTRRLAEAELQAAIKLEPDNASYRLMLAELYCDLGFFRRAEGELKRVMSAEPDNPGARRLLRRLEGARA